MEINERGQAMTNYKIGDKVWIQHDLGIEEGTVVGATNPEFAAMRPQDATVQVQFADGTNSSWGFATVVRHQAI